jgi:hypothetical protein
VYTTIRKEHQRADGDKASVVFSRPALNGFYLLGEAKVLALHPLFPWSSLDLVVFYRTRGPGAAPAVAADSALEWQNHVVAVGMSIDASALLSRTYANG